MRVIGGKLKGKLIHNPTDKTTRPLKDIVRESIFNILVHSSNEKIKFKNDIVLDFFSGSGNKIVAVGGRVINFVNISDSYSSSRKEIINQIKKLNWEDGFYRSDIGHKVIDR